MCISTAPVSAGCTHTHLRGPCRRAHMVRQLGCRAANRAAHHQVAHAAGRTLGHGVRRCGRCGDARPQPASSPHQHQRTRHLNARLRVARCSRCPGSHVHLPARSLTGSSRTMIKQRLCWPAGCWRALQRCRQQGGRRLQQPNPGLQRRRRPRRGHLKLASGASVGQQPPAGRRGSVPRQCCSDCGSAARAPTRHAGNGSC